MDGDGALAAAVLLHLLSESLRSGGEGHEESCCSKDCKPCKRHSFFVRLSFRHDILFLVSPLSLKSHRFHRLTQIEDDTAICANL